MRVKKQWKREGRVDVEREGGKATKRWCDTREPSRMPRSERTGNQRAFKTPEHRGS